MFDKNIKRALLLFNLSLTLIACGSSSSDNNNNPIDVDNDTTDAIDITDVEFTNTSANCASYTGQFESNVTDVNRNVAFHGEVTITADNTKCYFIANEIPNHDFHDGDHLFASDVSEQEGAYQIPKSPVIADQNTSLNLGTTNAIFLNGVTVDLLAAACYDVGSEALGQEKIGCGQDQINNPWRYDPMSPLNNFGEDSHNAHAQPDGTYHYHGSPLAMYNQDCDVEDSVSPVVGFAADGFPIYGPCFNDNGNIREARSSYNLKSDGEARQHVVGYTTPVAHNGDIASTNYDGQFRGDYEYSESTGDLDECNGMLVDGQYGYYLTNAYPWVIGCYKGTVDSSFVSSNSASMLRSLDHGSKVLHSHFH